MNHSFIRQSTLPSASHSSESARLASASTAKNASLNTSESDSYYNNASNNSYTNVSTSSATSRQQMNSAEFMEYLDKFQRDLKALNVKANTNSFKFVNLSPFV
jgi:hypothetical protein